jgi:DNA-directed RNA polymerase subunit RPC12/RpoP
MAKEVEIETRYTRDATCPYCGYANHDSWELPFDGEEDIETDCHKCEKTYVVSRSIDITYCSHKKEPA